MTTQQKNITKTIFSGKLNEPSNRVPDLYLHPPGRRQRGMLKKHLQIPVRIVTVIGVAKLEWGEGEEVFIACYKTWEEWATHHVNQVNTS